MTASPMTRRDLLKGGVTASLGAVMANAHSLSATGLNGYAGLSSLAREYDRYDGLALAELIARKQITPLELLRAVRERVEVVNPKLNALCHIFFDKAEAQINENLGTGPFRGVPFALKDLGIYMKATITSAGARMWKDTVADLDSTLVSRYKQAGLVIFGKTTSPELGLTPTTESVLFGETRNPWNPEKTSGGSSGGSAVLVAARVLPMAHGSDGGGSIRIPASCCGVFGFKPTRGRVPLGPTQFESWNGLSVHHALTISVRDSAALLDATAGQELGAPYFSPKPVRPFLSEVGSDPGRLLIALVTATLNGAPVDAECKKAAVEAAKLCETLGHKVEEVTLPLDGEQFSAAFLPIVHVSTARTLEDAGTKRGRPLAEQEVETVTWATAEAGRSTTSVAYSRAIASLHQIGLRMARFQESRDVVLSPTLAKPPVPLGVLSLTHDLATYRREVGAFSPYTALYNVTGQPSMSLPLGWSGEGLPIGVMFSGRFGEDALLFRLAAQLEKAQPWKDRKPAV